LTVHHTVRHVQEYDGDPFLHYQFIHSLLRFLSSFSGWLGFIACIPYLTATFHWSLGGRTALVSEVVCWP